MNQLINSQEELDQYIKDIQSGKIFRNKYSYLGNWTADEFPCVLGIYLDDTQYSMSCVGTAYGVIVYKSDFETDGK